MAPLVQDFYREAGHLITEGAQLLLGALNSNFGVALIGAAAGAFAGAWAAQLIASRTERRKSQLEEIRNINAAVNLAVGICNTYTSAKRQFILPALAELEETEVRLRTYKADLAANGIARVGPFEFKTEFRIYSPPDSPIDQLQRLIFDKISSDHFVLSVCQLLAQTIANGRDMLAQRNAMIGEFRDLPVEAGSHIVHLYLGLPLPGGRIDERYPNLVTGLQTQADDAIIFAKVLAERLSAHAVKLNRTYGRDAPKPAIPDFSRVERQGLLPEIAPYQELLAALRGEGPGAQEEAAARVADV